MSLNGKIVQLRKQDIPRIDNTWLRCHLRDGDLAICKQMSGDGSWVYAVLTKIDGIFRPRYRLLGLEFNSWYTCGVPYKFQPTNQEVSLLLDGANVSLEAELPKKTSEKPPKHPMQPIVMSSYGVVTFLCNQIVRDLLSVGSRLTLNDIEARNYSKEDREQFYQLTGMSVSAYGSLPFISEETRDEADRIAEEILAKKDSE